jgi:hypothetical protein
LIVDHAERGHARLSVWGRHGGSGANGEFGKGQGEQKVSRFGKSPYSTGQGGEIGRRARLRIAKSSISERCFGFQIKVFLRGKEGQLRWESLALRIAGEN